MTTEARIDRTELGRHLASLSSRTDDGVLVLADWLQQQGHPWGELIVLQHRGADTKAFLEAHPEIFGRIFLPYSHFEWERGFLRRASIATDAKPASMIDGIERLFAEPIAALIDTVAIAPYAAELPMCRDWGASLRMIVDPWKQLEAIVAAIPSRITRIGLGGWPVPAAAGYVMMPSFDRVTEVLGKRVTALELTGSTTDDVGVLVLPNVTELAVRFSDATSATIEAIGKSELPKLERLTLWLGATSNVTIDDVHPPRERDEVEDGESRYAVTTFDAADLEGMDPYASGLESNVYDEDLLLLAEAGWARNLTHLDIGTPDWTIELISVLASPGFLQLLPALKSLTISGGTVTESEMASLTRDAFAHLESFRITSVIGAGAAPKLAAEFPGIALRTDNELEDFHFRYVATVE